MNAMTKFDELGVKFKHRFFYVKEAFIPSGIFMEQHKHKFDHESRVISGTAIVRVDGEDTMLFQGDSMIIKAHAVHKVTAVTDVIWHCIHETDTDEREPAKIDEALIEN